MAVHTQEITDYIERNYSKNAPLSISNCSDLNIEAKINFINQYVIGVTEDDKFNAGSISQYEYRLREKLTKLSSNLVFLPWPFYDYEMEELKSVLKDLSGYFNANLEIDKMLKNIERPEGIYYIIITVIQIPILYAE